MERTENDNVVSLCKKLDPNAPAFKPGAGLLLSPQPPLPLPPPPPPAPAPAPLQLEPMFSLGSPHQHQRCHHNSSSRALRIIGIPLQYSSHGAGQLQEELSAWGPVRALQIEPDGEAATVCYFDLRSAVAALNDIRHQHLKHQCRVRAGLLQSTEDCCSWSTENGDLCSGLIGGQAVWAHYTFAVGIKDPDNRLNQGTLVAFNVDASAHNALIWNLFEKYGSVKEVRDGPPNRQHKFIEFFDIRDAALALESMDGQEIAGRRIKLEFSHRPNTFLRKEASPPLSPSSPLPPMNCYGPDEASHGYNYLANTQPPFASIPIGPSFGLNICTDPPIQNGEGIPLGHNLILCSSSSDSSLLHQNFNADDIVYMADCNIPPQRRGVRNEVACNSSSLNEPVNEVERCDLAVARDQLMKGYMFNEAEAEFKDGRTTLMVRNIPNKYSQEKLLTLLDEHCAGVNSEIENSSELFSAYDFVYLPMDFKNRCNLGYAFVNFTTSQATAKFHKVFDGREWGEFHSRKICKVNYARVQGRTSLEDHFRNSRFACDTDEFLPRVFTPPRNGLNMLGNGSNSSEDGEHQEVSGSTSESGSFGRGWMGIGIVLGCRLSGHYKGGLPQGQG